MTIAEAKQLLLLRRGPADDVDPQMREALAMAESDPALQEWLRAQETFHDSLRTAFRQLPVPAGLEARILAHSPAERLAWWQRFPAWSAAAALVVALALVCLARALDDQSFSTFRSRMVRSVLRQYQMDIKTNSMPVIRQFLTTNQAPSDYVLTAELDRLVPRGAGLQSWLRQRVSMVCLDAKSQGTAILFIVDSSTVRSPPPATPAFRQVSKLMTASWTVQGRAYLLMLDNKSIDKAQLKRLLQGPP